MNTPTLEEVREYFKDAEKVKDWNKDKGFVEIDKIERSDEGSFIQNAFKENWLVLWHYEKGYAKILSYKEPKEKTYKITKEQIKEIYGHSKPYGEIERKLKEWFPEVFETKLAVGKWYKFIDCGNLVFYKSDKEKSCYGFGYCSNTWLNEMTFDTDGRFKEATEQEVTEALTKEAVRRGFKEKDLFIELNNKQYQLEKEIGTFQFLSNILFYQGAPIFNDGKWAEIIPTISKQEAEAKLKEIGVNAKIV